LSMGAEWDRYKYSQSFSSLFLSQSGFSTERRIRLSDRGTMPGAVRADRIIGSVREWLFPSSKSECTASVRFDDYAKCTAIRISAVADPAPACRISWRRETCNTFRDTTLNCRSATRRSRWSRSAFLRNGVQGAKLNDIAGASLQRSTLAPTCPFPGSPGACLAAPNTIFWPVQRPIGGSPQPETSSSLASACASIRVATVDRAGLLERQNQIRSNLRVCRTGRVQQSGRVQESVRHPYLDPAGFQTIAWSRCPSTAVRRILRHRLECDYHVDLGFGNSMPTGSVPTCSSKSTPTDRIPEPATWAVRLSAVVFRIFESRT